MRQLSRSAFIARRLFHSSSPASFASPTFTSRHITGSMRAIVVDEANKAKASSLSIGEIDTPRLQKQNDVLVNIKAFGLNRMDIMQRKGLVS